MSTRAGTQAYALLYHHPIFSEDQCILAPKKKELSGPYSVDDRFSCASSGAYKAMEENPAASQLH